MKAVLNIPKRRGSSVCTRNGALLEAARTNCLDWDIESDRPLEKIRARQALRDRLSMTIEELNGNPHRSFADHEAAGVFGGIYTLERRGFWRVELEVSP